MLPVENICYLDREGKSLFSVARHFIGPAAQLPAHLLSFNIFSEKFQCACLRKCRVMPNAWNEPAKLGDAIQSCH